MVWYCCGWFRCWFCGDSVYWVGCDGMVLGLRFVEVRLWGFDLCSLWFCGIGVCGYGCWEFASGGFA